MAARVPARLTAAEGRKFGLVLGGAFLVLGGLLAVRGRRTAGAVIAAVGVVLTLAALLAPTRLGPVQAIWMKFGRALSKVTSPVFMSLVFFLVMTPLGLLARAFGHRPLTSARSRSTAWADRAAGQRRSELGRQF